MAPKLKISFWLHAIANTYFCTVWSIAAWRLSRLVNTQCTSLLFPRIGHLQQKAGRMSHRLPFSRYLVEFHHFVLSICTAVVHVLAERYRFNYGAVALVLLYATANPNSLRNLVKHFFVDLSRVVSKYAAGKFGIHANILRFRVLLDELCYFVAL